MRPIFSAALLTSAILASGCLYDPMREEKLRTEAFDLLTRGQQLKRQGDYILARDQFLKALEVSPRPVLYYELGNTYLRLERPEEAIPWYDKALEMRSDYQLAAAERDLALRRETLESPADSELAQAPQEESETDGRRGIARLFGGPDGPGSLSEADARQLRRSIFPELEDLSEFDTAQLTTFAENAARGNRYDETARYYEEILRREPENAEVLLEYGKTLLRLGRSEQGRDIIFQAAALEPENAEIFFEKGNYHLSQDEPARARDALNRALELDPDHLRARNNLAVLLIELDRPAEAIEQLEDLLDRGDFAPAWLNLALAQEQNGATPEEVLALLENYVRRVDNVPAKVESWMRELKQ